MRRIAGILILLGMGSSVAAQTSQPPIMDKADGVPGKAAERRIKFQPRGLPWTDVFHWLSKETGKPVITPFKVPGTMSIHVPDNANYTLPETIDLINEALLEEKFILIQRERTFSLLPADQKVGGRVPYSSVEELSKRGNTEIVRIDVRLNSLAVEDIQGQVKRLLSPFGEVVAIPQANTLILTDTVSSLKQVLRILPPDDPKKENALKAPVADPVLKQYEVLAGKAEPIARALQEIYKDAAAIRITAVGNRTIMVHATPVDQTDIEKKIQAFDPRQTTRLIPCNGLDPSKTADTLRSILGGTVSGLVIEAQPDRGGVLVTGSLDQVTRAQEVINVLQGTGPGGVRVITLEKGSAAALAEAIERMMKDMRKNPVNVISPTREKKPPPKEK